MRRERNTLTDRACLVRGFLSGSLILGAVVTPPVAFQVLAFVLGIFVFIDTLFIFGRNVHVFTLVVSLVLGGLISLGVFLFSFSFLYTAFAFVLVALYYIFKLVLARKG